MPPSMSKAQAEELQAGIESEVDEEAELIEDTPTCAVSKIQLGIQMDNQISRRHLPHYLPGN